MDKKTMRKKYPMSFIARELKTHLSTMKFWTQLQVLKREIDRLANLIDELLLFTKEGSSKSALSTELISLHDLIGETVDQLQILTKNHTTSLAIPERFYMTADKIKQVLINLLSRERYEDIRIISSTKEESSFKFFSSYIPLCQCQCNVK